MTGFETANKYKVSCLKEVPSNRFFLAQVLNSVGQEVYKAKEDTDCCTRQVRITLILLMSS